MKWTATEEIEEALMATTPPDWNSYAAASGAPWASSKPAVASISRNDSVTSLAFFGSQSAACTCASCYEAAPDAYGIPLQWHMHRFGDPLQRS